MRRRDLLKLAGLGVLVGCGDNLPYDAPGPTEAVALLEPVEDAVLVAIWAPSARRAVLEVRQGGVLVAQQTVAIDREAGRAAVDVTGLSPATTYEVTVTTDYGARLEPHRVRTAPEAGDPRPVRLAVGADLDPSPAFDSDLLLQLAAVAPDQYVSIGDFPYTDNGPVAQTVAQYRVRHAELRTTPKVRAWLETVGVRAIYDDHEFRNNWDAMFVAKEPARYAAAIQVWDEFFPLRDPPPEIRYRAWRYGANVECFLLDTRRFRSADAAPDGPDKTMLGATQYAWLVDAVTRSAATFKLIFTTVPLDFGTGNDFWASFAYERDRMFAALVGVSGLLFVSGDQHFFAAHRHAYGIREFQIGPLARGLGTPGPTAPGVLFRSVQYNFGLIDVAGAKLVFTGVGADGQTIYQETFTPADLTPA